MLGIRLAGGIDLVAFKNRFGVDLVSRYSGDLEPLLQSGVLEIGGGFMRLSPAGHFLGSQVAMVFVEAQPELARS